MKKKLILIALCGALALGVTACSANDVGDMVSNVGETASEVIEDTASAIDNAASTLESAAGNVTSNQSGNVSGDTSADNTTTDKITTADQALSALKSGNQAYLNGTTNMNISTELRNDLADNGQNPHTIVITCSDSRVPPELIFDSSLGDLFVIRTAGNVVGDYEIGSVEYAADHLGSPLVLVLGHSECGAVGAAIEGHATGNIASIVEEITPSVTKAKETQTEEDKIADEAENLNVENTIKNLEQSETLSKLIEEGKLTIKGAKYDIHTGEVTFFDN